MPDSLISSDVNRLYIDQVPSDDPGMLHLDAPPILAFYMNPGGLAAINRARCAAAAIARVGHSTRWIRIEAEEAFRERLDHPMPAEIVAYILSDLR